MGVSSDGRGQLADETKRALLQRLRLEKFHIEPKALALSPMMVRNRYPHIFAPLDELLDQLRPCPSGLLGLWLECPRGHVVLSHLESAYQEGEYELKSGTIEGVARVRVADLSQDTGKSLEAIAHLLDHLMGCYCEPGGPWLSGGTGINPLLADVGRRLAEYASLGYLASEATMKSPRDHFAIAFVGYLLDPKRLNIADPLTHKLLHRSLMFESFWKRKSGGS